MLIAQELIHDLNHRGGRASPNIALKLDMAKAYDRVQWPFLVGSSEAHGVSKTVGEYDSEVHSKLLVFSSS